MVDQFSRQVGVNLRRLRLVDGMSLDVLAGRSGLSKSFLSRVENGERYLERRKHLSAVATALDCDIADLIGQPMPAVGAAQQSAHAAVPSLRRALHAYLIGHLESDGAPPIMDLRTRAAALWQARIDCDPEAVWRIMPRLVADLHAHIVHGSDQREAVRLMVEVSSAAAFQLRGLGYADLAWMASQCSLTAAHDLDEPAAVGLAQYTHAQASALGHGYAGALHIAERAAEDLRPRLTGDTDDLRVYGTLLVMSSWAAGIARDYDRVDPYLSEALDLGERLGDPGPGGDRWQTYFGPTNNVIWQMSIAVEASAGGRAAELAQTANAEAVGSKSRQAAYWTELGVGLSLERGREDDSIDALERADLVAPARTRNSAQVRAAVTRMLDNVKRRSTRRRLVALASRVGIETVNGD